MKVLIKILLAILAVGGICYWLLSKCAQPAKRIKAWHDLRREADVDELLTPEDEESAE